jgi:hypothetical protein
MIEGLRHILEKQVVIPTFNADALNQRPDQVDADYTHHAYTFIPMGTVDDTTNRLVKQIAGNKTMKGMLIAPYGFGKTSTLVFLWYRCQEQQLLAVPPFYCSSLLDILRSTYGWVRYRFTQIAPGLLADIDALYHRHYASTIEERAKTYARDFGVSEHTARGMLQRQQESGEYRIQLTAQRLLAFLSELVPLVEQAGFRGLVLFPDEFQAFIGRSENVRQTLQTLREFIWELMGVSLKLGVIISSDDTTESRIQTGGGDILDRLRADGFYINLRTVYDQSFPMALWERYKDTFDLGDAVGLIDQYTLCALGQIAEREDLARGPRTVIDAFKAAIRHYERTGRNYTPMDLIDDFLEERIRFEEQNVIKRETRKALSVSTVDRPERQQAVKLMAAFPRGVTRQTSDQYNLTQAINDLSKGGGHGELMYRLVDGYTLLGLQRTGDGSRHIVDRMIAEYGRDYEPDELHVEAATRAFERHILSKLFATRRGGQAIGWTALELTPSHLGSRYGEIEGSFTPQYPRRKVAVQLAYRQQQLVEEREAHDLQFDFLLNWDESETDTGAGRIELVEQHTIRWHLALRTTTEGQVPGDIAKIQQYINPAFISPLLLLALIDFIDRWEQDHNERVPERDRPEITLLIDRLSMRAVEMLLSQGLHASWEGTLKRAGAGLVEEVFTAWMGKQYPDYVTFFNHAQYQEVIKRYQDAVNSLPKKEARGHASLRRDKNELAKLFGLTSVSTFENMVDTAYRPLLKKVSWEGREGELLCRLHPLEQQVMDQIRADGTTHYVGGVAVQGLPTNIIAQQAYMRGYRDEEILLTLQILFARRLTSIQRGSQNIAYIPVDTLNAETLQSDLAAQQSRLKELPAGLLPGQQLNNLEKQATELTQRLETTTDEEELDEINHAIARLREEITSSVSEQQSVFEGQLREQRHAVDDELVALNRTRSQIEPVFQGQVGFVQHLSALRMELMNTYNNVKRTLETQRTTLTSSLEAKGGDPVAVVLELQKQHREAVSQLGHLKQQVQQLRTYCDGLDHWRNVLKQADALFAAPGLPNDLRHALTDDVVPTISEHLVKRRFEGLKDWETFRQKVEAINQKFSARQTAGNKQFGEVKDAYLQLLRELRVSQSALRARYEYGADDDSYRDLFEEVVGKIQVRLDELGGEIERVNSDLIRVQYLQNLTTEQRTELSTLKSTHKAATQLLAQMKTALTVTMVQDRETALPNYSQQVITLDEQLSELRTGVGKLLTVDTSRTPEEEQFMALLEGRQDYDLTQLFLSLRRQQEIDLEQALEILRGLFKKGQIEIKVRRRAG